MPKRAASADHSPGVTAEEYAVFCWLRLHPDVAATYGIKTCKHGCAGCGGRAKCQGVNGKTTIGWMLMQLLEAQGADVSWYARVPAHTHAKGGNEAAAAMIKFFTKRPGQFLEQLKDRLREVAAPENAAVRRKRLPQVSLVPSAHEAVEDRAQAAVLSLRQRGWAALRGPAV